LQTFKRPVFLNRLNGVIGTAGIKTTVLAQGGRQEFLVESYTFKKKVLDCFIAH